MGINIQALFRYRIYLIYWFMVFNSWGWISYITEAPIKGHYDYFAGFQSTLMNDALYIHLYTLLFPRSDVWTSWEGCCVMAILLVLMDVTLRLRYWKLAFLPQGNGHEWHHVLYLCVSLSMCTHACEVLRSSRSRYTGSCEMPRVDGGNWIQVLYKITLNHWVISSDSRSLILISLLFICFLLFCL